MKAPQELFLVSGNKGKLVEFKRFLPDIQQLDIDLPEIQGLDPQKVVAAKLKAASKYDSKGWLLVEDTSLELDCFDGLPGPLVKWFEEAMGLAGMAEKAENLGTTRAVNRVIIGLVRDDQKTHFFEGMVEGDFVRPRGDKDFGWGPSFQPKGHDKTFGELSRQEKDLYSARGHALRKLVAHLGSL